MNARLKQSTIQFALCSAGIIGLGFGFYGDKVLDRHTTYFQFLVLGVTVPLLVVAMQMLRPRWVALLGVVAYVAIASQSGKGTWATLDRDAVWLLSMILAVRTCLWGSLHLRAMRFGKFVAWGAVFALAQLGALYLLAFNRAVAPNPALALTVAGMGALVGLGAGIGFELSAFIAGGASPATTVAGRQS